MEEAKLNHHTDLKSYGWYFQIGDKEWYLALHSGAGFGPDPPRAH